MSSEPCVCTQPADLEASFRPHFFCLFFCISWIFFRSFCSSHSSFCVCAQPAHLEASFPALFFALFTFFFRTSFSVCTQPPTVFPLLFSFLAFSAFFRFSSKINCNFSFQLLQCEFGCERPGPGVPCAPIPGFAPSTCPAVLAGQRALSPSNYRLVSQDVCVDSNGIVNPRVAPAPAPGGNGGNGGGGRGGGRGPGPAAVFFIVMGVIVAVGAALLGLSRVSLRKKYEKKNGFFLLFLLLCPRRGVRALSKSKRKRKIK